MVQELQDKIKEICEKTAEEMGLVLVSFRFLRNGENGPTLEVLIDRDFDISLDEINRFTDKVNPLIDAIDDTDEAYVLDISSGGSERDIPFDGLARFVDSWLDIELKTGEKITALCVSFQDGILNVSYFIKGRKKKLSLKQEDVKKIRMGYKA